MFDLNKAIKNNTYGFIVLCLGLIIAGIFAFSYSNGKLKAEYFFSFLAPTGAMVLILIFANWAERRQQFNKIFAFNEQTPFMRNTMLKLALGLFLAFVFSVGALNLGTTFQSTGGIIDIPQPFTETGYATVTGVDKAYYQAVHPGFVEETGIYFLIVQPIKFILVMLFAIKRPKLMLLFYLIAAGIGAGVLMQAHRIAYGSDAGAYFGVFLFEFIVQFFNLFSGMFISLIPHIIHNGVVALSFAIAFSIGGVGLHFYPIWRRKNETSC